MFFCKDACAPADPASDTVKVDFSSTTAPPESSEAMDRRTDEAAREAEARQRAEEAEARQRAEEEERSAEEARLRAQEEDRVRRLEEERLLQISIQEEHDAEELRRGIEASRLQQEQEEAAHRQREAEERAAEQARKAEAERVHQEQMAALSSFLSKNRFKDAMSAKRSFMSTTYPIHYAAKAANADIVSILMKEGADPLQKNSSGKTALQVAQKTDTHGSHAAVLRVLGGA